MVFIVIAFIVITLTLMNINQEIEADYTLLALSQRLEQAEVFSNCQPYLSYISYVACSILQTSLKSMYVPRRDACEEGGIIWTKYFNTALDKGDHVSAQTKEKDKVSCCAVLYASLLSQ